MAFPSGARNGLRSKQTLAVLVPILGCVLWSYWTTLERIAQSWSQDAMYSHGYLVPGFALALLWLRRKELAATAQEPTWWGMPFLAAALLLRLGGTYYYRVWLEQLSLLPCLAGIFVMTGGWAAWRWAWPATGFLFFMIPLPYELAGLMTGPLQFVATAASTFCLQTLGLPALADGNVIRLNDQEINIVEACSGLRMLVIFFALSTAVVLIIRRPVWQKIVIVGSALPIALIVNIMRITATGVLFETVGTEWAKAVFHDLAGWLMMPVALGFLGLELKLLARLFVEIGPIGPGRPGTYRPLRSSLPGRGPAAPRRKWVPVGGTVSPSGKP
jgi:exosortase